MKVLFVYPNVGAQIGFNYGLASIIACLKRDGHEVHLLNINDKLGDVPTDAEFHRQLDRLDPDLVGFSIVTTQWPLALKLARHVRDARPGTPIVAGGVHASMVPGDILDTGAFDYACVGEGEQAVCELAHALERGQPTESIRNLWVRLPDGSVRHNPVRPFAPLDELPMKDYEAFDFQAMIDAKHGWVGLMTSRGCPFSCTYCFNHSLVDIYRRQTGLSGRELNYIRHHPVGQVIDEIDHLLSRYRRITMFIFDDDLFTFNRDYVMEFCRRYAERFDVPFVCNAHVKVFDDELAGALKRAGCSIVKFGLESGSPRVRSEVMRRHMSNDEISRAFTTAARAGLHSSAFVMMGLPTETIDEIYQTVDLLATSRPGRFRWAVFFPFPGTQAHDIAAEHGLIDPERMQTLQNFTDQSCLDLGPEQNLLIDKLAHAFPWFVNARAGGPQAEPYQKKVDEILALDESAWQARTHAIREEDRMLSDEMVRRGIEHYAIKYNAFTGVSSSWFLREDS